MALRARDQGDLQADIMLFVINLLSDCHVGLPSLNAVCRFGMSGVWLPQHKHLFKTPMDVLSLSVFDALKTVSGARQQLNRVKKLGVLSPHRV